MDTVAFATVLAPEVDELVFSVHRKARTLADPFRAAQEAAGVRVMGRLDGVFDLLLCDRLTERAALLRGRYHPAETIRADLEELVSHGHLERRDEWLMAGPTLRRLVELAEQLRAEAAAALWADAAADAAGAPIPAILAASPVADGLLASQLVAPEHAEAPHRLFQRLSRLRYLRNDAHADAWASHGVAARDMVTLTAAWRDADLPDDPDTRASLTERGLLSEGGRLTDDGRRLRERIEAETNVRNAVALEVVDPTERLSWLDALRALPRFPPPAQPLSR